MQRSLLDDSNADRLFCLIAFGKALIAEGDFRAAEEQFRIALGILEQRPRDTWTVGEVKSSLGECLLRSNRLSEAEPYLLGAYQTLAPVWGDDHPRTRKAGKLLAEVYELSGRADEAAKFKEPARQIDPSGGS